MTKLEKIRTEKGLKQQEIAEFLSITTSSYCMYENNQRKVPLEKADKIAEFLEVDRDEIFLPSTFTGSETTLKEC